ncbi:MAG: hypothetical protein IMZ53_01425 [Thermoplasmata archaeon]|nr:hypothetical protein [Thermoplasmata archaeon]MBE3139223.1 hypothetical protein [Thermoplasmata archaeon]
MTMKGNMKLKKWLSKSHRILSMKYLVISIDFRYDFWRNGFIIWFGTSWGNSDDYNKSKGLTHWFDLTIINCGLKIEIKSKKYYTASFGIYKLKNK